MPDLLRFTRLTGDLVKAIMACPPTTWCRMCAMPTASVGAPPAREMIVVSPTSWAVLAISSGVAGKPIAVTAVEALSAVVPTRAAGLFMVK